MSDEDDILIEIRPEHFELFRSMARNLLPTYDKHQAEMKQQEGLAFRRGMKPFWIPMSPYEFKVYCDESGWAYNAAILLRCARKVAGMKQQQGQGN